VLGELKMLQRPVRPVAHPIWLDGAAPRIVADSTSFFFASVDRGTRVKRGQVLGYTTDLLGKKTGDVVAPIDGLVTFIRGVPSAWPRATLATVLGILPSPRPWKAPTP
jgi:predicted deacylase